MNHCTACIYRDEPATGGPCAKCVIGNTGIPTEYVSADAPAAAQEAAGGANERQVGGSHYQKAIQPWDYIAANGLGYFEGNVVKYVSRWRDKAGVEDLKKARHYLDKLIELQGGN
jgi:hypothetical protein